MVDTENLRFNVVRNFDHLSRYCRMTQFREKREKPIFYT